MNPEFEKSKFNFSVILLDSIGGEETLHVSLKEAVKYLIDMETSPSEIMNADKYAFYIARDNKILKVSPATLCRALGNMFREEGIGCDI